MVAAGAAVTLLVGLVTNVASQEQRWPGVLADVQRHPWVSLGVLAVGTMVLSGVQAALSDRADTEQKKPAEMPRQEAGPVAAAEVMSTLPRDVSAFTNREARSEMTRGPSMRRGPRCGVAAWRTSGCLSYSTTQPTAHVRLPSPGHLAPGRQASPPPSWTIDDVKARLVRAQDSLAEMLAGERAVAAAFDLSYQDLPADRQGFFRHISVFPGATFDEFSTAALDNTTTETARIHLEALYEDHLLDENADSRYRMHDLVRAYGRRLAAEDPPGDSAPVDRLGEYDLAAIAAANRFIERSHGVIEQPTAPSRLGVAPIDSLPTAMSWLAVERANVLACIDEFVPAGQHSFVVRLATAMAPYLRRVGPWDEAADLYRVTADTARRSGDRRGEAQAMANPGMVSRYMADYPKAQEALEQSLAAYREISVHVGQAHTLNQLGIVWYMVAAYRQAAQAQTEALAHVRRHRGA